jgi:hypothetical protein
MGLHLCYELRLPGDTSEDQVRAALVGVRELAREIRGARVTELHSASVGELREHKPAWAESLDAYFFSCASLMVDEGRSRVPAPAATPDRTAAIGFGVNPGRGCEGATFGLAHCAAGSAIFDDEPPIESDIWFWHHCCKTQYASVVSNEHLIHCHLSLVALVEECERRGIAITVRDQTGYWETRSTAHLVAEVEKMNRLIAGIAGRLSDAISPNYKAQGAIFAHPDFERMETKARESD